MLYSDDSGSAGLDMGEEVARDAFICHLVSLVYSIDKWSSFLISYLPSRFCDATRPGHTDFCIIFTMRDCLLRLPFTPTTEDTEDEDCISAKKTPMHYTF